MPKKKKNYFDLCPVQPGFCHNALHISNICRQKTKPTHPDSSIEVPSMVLQLAVPSAVLHHTRPIM